MNARRRKGIRYISEMSTLHIEIGEIPTERGRAGVLPLATHLQSVIVKV